MPRRGLKFAFLGISILVVVGLLSTADLRSMIASLASVRPSHYAFAFLVYLLSYLCRALRLSVLFGRQSPLVSVIVFAGHNFVNQFLPFRAGEVSLLVLLKSASGIRYSASLPALILLRILDLLTLLLTFVVVFALSNLTIDLAVVVLCGILVPVCIVALWRRGEVSSGLFRIAARLVPKRYHARLETVRCSSEEVLSIESVKIGMLLALSLAERLCHYLLAVVLVMGMAYPIPPLQVVAANAMASIALLVPVNSFGNFGTYELGWAGALSLFGNPIGISVASGFNFHLLVITYTISLGLLSVVGMVKVCGVNPLRRRPAWPES